MTERLKFNQYKLKHIDKDVLGYVAISPNSESFGVLYINIPEYLLIESYSRIEEFIEDLYDIYVNQSGMVLDPEKFRSYMFDYSVNSFSNLMKSFEYVLYCKDCC